MVDAGCSVCFLFASCPFSTILSTFFSLWAIIYNLLDFFVWFGDSGIDKKTDVVYTTEIYFDFIVRNKYCHQPVALVLIEAAWLIIFLLYISLDVITRKGKVLKLSQV